MMVKLSDSRSCEELPVLTLFPSLVKICPHPCNDGRCLSGGPDVIFHGYLSSGCDVVIQVTFLVLFYELDWITLVVYSKVRLMVHFFLVESMALPLNLAKCPTFILNYEVIYRTVLLFYQTDVLPTFLKVKKSVISTILHFFYNGTWGI